jgi:predicted PurR-regulated permease PerM
MALRALTILPSIISMSDTSTSGPDNFVQTLSPFQRRLVATALALIAAVVITAFLFSILMLLQVFVKTFSSVLWPLAVAGILALILRPVVRWFEDTLKCGRNSSILLLYGLVVVVLIAVAALIIPVLFNQTVAFVEKAPTLWSNIQEAFRSRYPQVIDFLESQLGSERLDRYQAALSEQIEKAIGFIAPAAQDLVSQISGVISLATGLAIIPVYLFFFLQTDRDPTRDLDDQLSFIRKDWRQDAVFLIKEFAGSMVAFFRGQILIGLIMGVLLALGFSIAGISFGIVLGLIIGALNIIPYLGTIVGLGLVLPMAYFQPDGGLTLLCIALGIFFAVQLIEGYLLTPRIMGRQTGLHPLTIIIAIFFWGVALNGLLGMILAIPLTAFFVVAWRLVKMKYLHKQNPSDARKAASSAS